MQIIVVSDKLATAKSFTLTSKHLVAVAAGHITIILLVALLLAFSALRMAAGQGSGNFLQTSGLISVRQATESAQESLNSLAMRLGQMQAELLRLNSLSERLAALSGIKQPATTPSTPQQPAADGRGGPLIKLQEVSPMQLSSAADLLSRELDVRSETFSALENLIMEDRINRLMLPTSLPVNAQWNSSGFGWRLDPFTGESAMHEGVDFVAPTGTPIRAAAAGVVLQSERISAYGLMVDIDHGNGLVTRYAHCSKLRVEPGQVVRRGDVIAEVGNTGRSTGSHLHFEVRVNGIAQNPNRFLENARSNAHQWAKRPVKASRRS
jgi:murein DD-endopeptidase MepM/ murein hydrolase activator NlpD